MIQTVRLMTLGVRLENYRLPEFGDSQLLLPAVGRREEATAFGKVGKQYSFNNKKKEFVNYYTDLDNL